MPDFDDFFAFQITSSDSDSAGEAGCSTGFVVLAAVVFILWLIGLFFG
ncbi:MAG: hypothetical protein UHK54_02475 [Acutalibacteraceae bacterium]|nr:hypothetical protein [Acutalibacteraceae bacterium]